MLRKRLIVLFTLVAVGALLATVGVLHAETGDANRLTQLIAVADQNGDGVITRDEFGTRVLAVFDRVDANDDTRVTQAECDAALTKLDNKLDKVVANFGRIDKNGDGVLTRDECPERMARLFDRVDANKDGKITSPELAETTQRLRELADGFPQRWLKRFDANKDDIITREEVTSRLDALFTRIDTDADGKLTQHELQAAAQALRNAAQRRP